MKISKQLNLIVPITTDSGTLYIHSRPILRETFKHYFMVLAKTLNTIYSEGISQGVGPSVAALTLESIAKENDPVDPPNDWKGNGSTWSGTFGVKRGLMDEIRRLSNVVVPADGGWESLPVSEAIKQGFLDESDVEEAEGYIVFFTCVSHIHKKNEIEPLLNAMGKIWDTQVSSLSVSEFCNSLPKSTATEILPMAVKQSSIPG